MAAISMSESDIKWRQRFMFLADHVASWSKDPSTQVGAVITCGKEVVSLGYNGFPSRTPDRESFLENREEKYPRTVHAEMNAILRMKVTFPLAHPLKIYTTHVPCNSCAAVIIAAGISEVIMRKPSADFSERWSSIEKSIKMFQEAGISLSLVDF